MSLVLLGTSNMERVEGDRNATFTDYSFHRRSGIPAHSFQEDFPGLCQWEAAQDRLIFVLVISR